MLNNEFWDEVKKYNEKYEEQNTPTEFVPPSKSPTFNKSVLLQTIDDVDKLDDSQLRSFISHYFDNIITGVFVGDKTNEYIRVFQNTRFLDALLQTMQTYVVFNNDQIIKLNTICYDYFTLPKENRNDKVVYRMIQMSNIVNRMYLPRLLGLGLSSNLANKILVARFSSHDINICVKRVNFLIITQPKELMSEEMIISIFRIIYNKWNDFTFIFTSFMRDILPEYNDSDVNTLWITDEITEVNSVMNLAMLAIINELPEVVIYNSLKNYASDYYIIGFPVRFSLRSINSYDYPRIIAVINNLMNENIIVP